MTHDEMIAVIQADKDGKEIEFDYRPSIRGAQKQDFTPIPANHKFDFSVFEYRVKPPHIEAWGVVKGECIEFLSTHKELTEIKIRMTGGKLIRLIPDPNYTQSPVSDNE